MAGARVSGQHSAGRASVAEDLKLEPAGSLQDRVAGEETEIRLTKTLFAQAPGRRVFLTEVEKPVGGADWVGRAGVWFGFGVFDATHLTDIHVGIARGGRGGGLELGAGPPWTLELGGQQTHRWQRSLDCEIAPVGVGRTEP